MIDRKHIEQILKLNGLNPTAADEEIRSVLISAKWHAEDVETALTVLRENVNTHQSHKDTLHNVFLTDKRLSPEAIESLLGIDVEVSSAELVAMKSHRQQVSYWQVVTIVVYSIAFAFVVILGVMYYEHISFFHPGF